MTCSVVLDGDSVSHWVMSELQGQWLPGWYQGIGLYEGQFRAGAAFEGYNGSNILCHIVVKEPPLTLFLFRLICRYVYGQLGLKRLTLVADSSNIAAVQLHERLGGIPEGRLVGAGKSGDDILLSRLPDSNRFWRRWHGQEKLRTDPT